jgi:hypothetical protein
MRRIVHREEKDTLHSQDPSHRRQGCSIIGNVLQNAVADHQVDRLVREGEGGTVSNWENGPTVQPQALGNPSGACQGWTIQVTANKGCASAGRIQ